MAKVVVQAGKVVRPSRNAMRSSQITSGATGYESGCGACSQAKVTWLDLRNVYQRDDQRLERATTIRHQCPQSIARYST